MTSAIRLVREHLLADSDVMAEVDHVFPIRAKQGTRPPFLVLGLVHEDEWIRALTGASGQYEARVSVACHAKTALEADTIAEVVKESLGDFAGDVFTTDSPSVRLGTMDTWKSGAEVFDWSDDGSVFRRIVDFGVRWRP
jgi:hypothetical protein